ncbi:hypothetical protein F503_03007 [Ophiostoma piceae UAMH 11346]|uniref:Uncharacterized protein n=1 Tax=Ophiostoma piceae (strain UAMH 11346) TaxID=1262450 RepID=S3CIH9_OPHP1|nr:hypothetical protein F503_03007 [Ophiostoma piceae UAMH 11346]
MAPIRTWAVAVLAGILLGHVDAAVHLDSSRGQAPIGSDVGGSNGNSDSNGNRNSHTQLQTQTHTRLGYTPRLNFSSSAPHLFASAYGLLQQWSNTVFPNGHALAAATISPFTLMYHGLHVDDETAKDPNAVAPPSPEWLAFDLEMAYGIMGSTRRSWLLTYQTTRPVQVLYMDGESAALMGLGQLDSQMLLLYGNVTGPVQKGDRGPGLTDEYDRARGMCDWLLAQNLRGRGWGYEGIMRMNAGFEVIWCDFTSDSLRLVSRLNVTAPLNAAEEKAKVETEDKEETKEKQGTAAANSYYPLPPVPTRSDRVIEPTNPPLPPNWRGGDTSGEEPFLDSQGWGWFESATWHYGGSRAGPGAGETRVQIDNCGIVSYYAPRFAGSALAVARGQEERQHLNLTDDGFWEVEDDSKANRTVALRQLARRRRFHHLGNASKADAQLMRHSALTTLQRTVVRRGSNGQVEEPVESYNELDTADGTACSGASWTLILAEIVQRMVRHLKTVESILLDGPEQGADGKLNATATRAWLHKLRSQNHMFMVGYLTYPQNANVDPSVWQPDTALYSDTLALCRFRYTRLFGDDYYYDVTKGRSSLPREEDDMRWAIEETYGTMCGELLGIGFDVERKWAEHYAVAPAEGSPKNTKSDLAASARVWYDQLTELIAWLGWESEFIGGAEVVALVMVGREVGAMGVGQGLEMAQTTTTSMDQGGQEDQKDQEGRENRVDQAARAVVVQAGLAFPVAL